MTYLGHSTVLLDLPRGRLLTDPVLRSRVGFLRRFAPPPGAEAREGLGAVLVSHVHHDHLDRASLRMLGRGTPVVAPRGTRRLLRGSRIGPVTEMLPGETAQVGGITLRATPAAHVTTRLPAGRRLPAVGYVIEDGLRAYFAGDTDLFPEMRAIGDAGLDLALLPIAGWGPRVPPGHLDPLRAAQALALLRPALAVPIHWGTLAPVWQRGDRAHHDAAVAAFVRAAAGVVPDVEVCVLAPGETLALPPPAARD